jgi:ABC-type phosphate transport system substrate-binding protein
MALARFKQLTLAAMFLGCLAGSSPVKAQTEDMAVVVNKANPVNSLSSGELQRIFLGETQFWNKSKNVVTVIMRAPEAPERDMVLNVLYRMSDTEYRKYWIGRINKGEASSAPAEVFANGALQGLVRDIPGSIGVVKASEVSSGVKVLKVDGHLPGDSGYSFRSTRNKNVTISDASTK